MLHILCGILSFLFLINGIFYEWWNLWSYSLCHCPPLYANFSVFQQFLSELCCQAPWKCYLPRNPSKCVFLCNTSQHATLCKIKGVYEPISSAHCSYSRSGSLLLHAHGYPSQLSGTLSALNLRTRHAMIKKSRYIDYLVSENSLVMVLFQVTKETISLVYNNMLLIWGTRLKFLHFVRYSIRQSRIYKPPTWIWKYYCPYFILSMDTANFIVLIFYAASLFISWNRNRCHIIVQKKYLAFHKTDSQNS